MAFNPKPVGIIKRARGNASVPRPHFRCMANRCATKRTELHLQPPAAFIGPMLAACKLTLSDLHILLIEVGDHGEGATKPALAKPTVANHAHGRLRAHAIANSTACATTFMYVVHSVSYTHLTLPTIYSV